MNTETTQNETASFYSVVEDLFVIKPKVYWVDYIICTIFGWGFFIISLLPNIPVYFLPISLLIAIFALYRSAVFSHEIAHFEKNLPKSFCFTWHIFTGMPLFAPGFMYKQLHLSHHRKNNYATQNDPEYADFPHSPFEVFRACLKIEGFRKIEKNRAPKGRENFKFSCPFADF